MSFGVEVLNYLGEHTYFFDEEPDEFVTVENPTSIKFGLNWYMN